MKFTAVAGCAGFAMPAPARTSAPAAIAPNRTPRRVSMVPPRVRTPPTLHLSGGAANHGVAAGARKSRHMCTLETNPGPIATAKGSRPNCTKPQRS